MKVGRVGKSHSGGYCFRLTFGKNKETLVYVVYVCLEIGYGWRVKLGSFPCPDLNLDSILEHATAMQRLADFLQKLDKQVQSCSCVNTASLQRVVKSLAGAEEDFRKRLRANNKSLRETCVFCRDSRKSQQISRN